MKKIYLINPKFPVTYWGFEYSNDLSGLKYTSPPLGLATLAALTPQDIAVEICDENIEAINFETDADIIGLTAYLVQGPRVFQIAEEFRQRGKTVVLGGPITSLDPEACQNKVDVVFVGKAEYTWPQFLDAYRTGSYFGACGMWHGVLFCLYFLGHIHIIRDSLFLLHQEAMV